ncbi:MAG: aldo/keto reductase [Gemmatimonadaceae bacterium]|nr:aldo/keto reductase [Gemmatimonadaceae bacterium]
MSLATRPLGRSGPPITRVGFGSWAIGGAGWPNAWGPQDDDTAVAAMRHAVERGVSWIDTAAIYGHGHSEELVGRLLRELPRAERPLVFTKCGLRWDDAEPMKPAWRDLTPRSIREECEASLRRLGVETIDVFQFHRPDTDTGTPVEESWGEMGRLIDEGKVRWAGVSNFDVEPLERCEKVRHVDSFQPPFSLMRRDWGNTGIAWCERNGTGVIVYSPMQAGLLTDRFSLERVRSLPSDDWRTRSPEFTSPRVERNVAVRDALKPIAARHRTSVAAIAIAWTLHWPGVTAAIVGARSPDQVDGWIDAPAVALDASDLAAIESAAERSGAGSGPIRPDRARPRGVS